MTTRMVRALSARTRRARRSAGAQVRAIPLPGSPDLLDLYDPAEGYFFSHREQGVVAVGSALRLEIPAGPAQVARAGEAVSAALSSLGGGDVPAVAVGALPFDGERRPATLIIPRIAVVRRQGRTWMLVAGNDGPEPESFPHAPLPEPWDSLRVTDEPPRAHYLEAVARARDAVRAGLLQKVVLARSLVAKSDHPFDVPALVDRLRRVEPDAYVFGIPGLVGASPELLLARTGNTILSNPLAGTIVRSGGGDDEAARTLLDSTKDRVEHAVVVDAVRRALEPACSDLAVDEQPSVLATSRVLHLSSVARGVLREPEHVLATAARLHPTPAVCGTPRERARAAIARLEAMDRGLYSGIVGWCDAAGDGEWAVALRCAAVTGNQATLFAGAGIVAGSDPDEELAETDAKFRAMLDALRYA